MFKYYTFLGLSILGGIWSFLNFLFFAWLTATPLKEGQLERYQKSAGLWFLGMVIFLIIQIYLYRKIWTKKQPNQRLEPTRTNDN